MVKLDITFYKSNNKAISVYFAILTTTLITGFAYCFLPNIFSKDISRIIFSAVFTILILLFVHFLCRKDGTDFKAIYYNKNGFSKSLFYGVIFSFIIFILQGGVNLFNATAYFKGSALIVLSNMFNFLFLIGFFEEFIFRGYLAKKFFMYNKVVSTLLIGIMFVFAHVPLRFLTSILISHIDISTFFQIYSISFVYDFIFHIIMQVFYNKYHNSIGPVLVHFTINFISWTVLNCT